MKLTRVRSDLMIKRKMMSCFALIKFIETAGVVHSYGVVSKGD